MFISLLYYCFSVSLENKNNLDSRLSGGTEHDLKLLSRQILMNKTQDDTASNLEKRAKLLTTTTNSVINGFCHKY